MTIGLLLSFWVLQIVSQLIYKFGSTSPKYWIAGFVLGNVLGITSMWLQMKLYTKMDCGLAMGLGIGGAFFFSQLAFIIAFGAKLGYSQILAYTFMTAGMVLAGISTVKG